MAGSQRVVEEITEIKIKNRKIRNTVLDNFRKLTHDKEIIRRKNGVALLKHIFENKDSENGKTELKYALGRLIRGLGASKNTAKVGFYTVLVALFSSIDGISLSDIFEHVKGELHSSGGNSKSENADVFAGQILLYGSLIRTKYYERAPLEEKKYIIDQLVSAGKKRNYLYLSSIIFIIELCAQADEKEFKWIIWPALKSEVEKPWREQNIDSIYLLYTLRNLFPNIFNQKFLRRILGSDEIYSPTTFKDLTNILLNIPKITIVNHPFYKIISKKVCSENLCVDYIMEIDRHLIKFNYNRHLIATTILTHCIKHLPNPSILPKLLNRNYIQHTLQYFKSVKSSKNPETLQETIYNLFNILVDFLKNDNVHSDTKIEVIKRLLFYPGIFIFEKITRSKLIQNIIATFSFAGLEKLSELYREVILGDEAIFNGDEEKQACLNNDRVYAAQLLVKLLSHPNGNEKMEWKMKQLKLLMDLGLFRNGNGRNVSVELAASLKGTFFRALNLKLPKLKNLRDLLSNLVNDLNNRLTQQQLLRNPLSDDAMQIWTRSLEYIEKLESKRKKIYMVFGTLFLHMSLQLFDDTKLAVDSLKELFSCYERVRVGHKQLDESKLEDPLWIEVVIDLFLNLLSQKSSLLRNLINYVFPHLCKYVNATAMEQILDVLDPKNEGNPLIASDESEESVNEDDDSCEDESEESDESDEEDDNMMDDNINDKLKLAVQMALIGGKCDEESVDLDEMSESEGKQLDEALAIAFKQFKPNLGKKSNKQKKEDEALTHFRVRVLDLIDLYLDSEPSMYLCLEIMVVLLRCLEFSIKDEHQKPLSNRIRSSLKTLSNVKKFNSIEDIGETTLSDLFDSLLEKGTKNYFVMQEMNDKISECCLFIITCVEYLNSSDEVGKKMKKHVKKAIVMTMSQSLEMYFTKRECYIPYGLFKNVMSSVWIGTFRLIAPILEYIFNTKVKAFKRCQALELAKIFFGNHRLLNMYTTTDDLTESLLNFSENIEQFFGDTQNINVKDKFVRNLMNTLSVLKKSPIEQGKINWIGIGEKMKEFRANLAITKNTRVPYNKLCRLLGIDCAVTLKKNLIKLGTAENDISDQESVAIEANTMDTDHRKVTKSKRKNNLTKLKKETQMLRMQNLSEGLSIDFTEAGLKDERLDEDSRPLKRKSNELSVTEEGDGTKKKFKKNNGATI